jgi:hypothetical protein
MALLARMAKVNLGLGKRSELLVVRALEVGRGRARKDRVKRRRLPIAR